MIPCRNLFVLFSVSFSFVACLCLTGFLPRPYTVASWAPSSTEPAPRSREPRSPSAMSSAMSPIRQLRTNRATTGSVHWIDRQQGDRVVQPVGGVHEPSIRRDMDFSQVVGALLSRRQRRRGLLLGSIRLAERRSSGSPRWKSLHSANKPTVHWDGSRSAADPLQGLPAFMAAPPASTCPSSCPAYKCRSYRFPGR